MEYLVVLFVIILFAFLMKGSSQSVKKQPDSYIKNSNPPLSESPSSEIMIRVTINDEPCTLEEKLPKADPDSVWIAPNKSTKIEEFEIPDGMIYVGARLKSANGWDIEPSLINPTLPVATREYSDRAGEHMQYWPSYDRIPAGSRASYLDWLSTGRKDPNIDIGFVFLFFYGLERRLLLDAKVSEKAKEESPQLIEEIKRLLKIYGNNESFHGYATGLLSVTDQGLFKNKLYKEAPQELLGTHENHFPIQAGLAQASADGVPIDAEWALAWLEITPEIYLRTPAHRCEDEFKKLFAFHFSKKYPKGYSIKPNKSKLKLEYRPASRGFYGTVSIPTPDLPDPTKLTKPINDFKKLAEQCVDELEAYSRLLGRDPSAKGTPIALALLPDAIAKVGMNSDAKRLADFLDNLLTKDEIKVIRVSEIERIYSFAGDAGFSKKEAVSLAQVLGKLGYGIEPDVRFGTSSLKAEGQAAIFRLNGDQSTSATDEYLAATVLLHFGALVSGADGVIAREEENHLERHLEEVLKLSQYEKTRLKAHLKWLLAEQPNMQNLKKRLEALSPQQKAGIGYFAISIAGADGVIHPEEIKLLARVYKVLGLDTNEIYSHLHAAASEPVTVAKQENVSSSFAIPKTPKGEIKLNMVNIKNKIEETKAVSAILHSVFSDDEAVNEKQKSDLPKTSRQVFGLDQRHSQFVALIAENKRWGRDELERLAEKAGVMLDGALEIINDAAYQAIDQPFWEGDDPLEINSELLKELAK